MYYWTCEKYRNGVRHFIKDIDLAGYPIETTNEWIYLYFLQYFISPF